MTAIRLGVIGAGIMGGRMLAAAHEFASESVTLIGVWDPSPEASARMAAFAPAAASVAALIAGSDCVYIASPPASHIPLADQVLAAGKAVFCEKPLASDVPAAVAFVARAAGARAAVNFPMATSFAAERLRAWIAEGVVGAPQKLDIEVAFATWPRGWQQGAASWLDRPAEGGFTREVISHFLFLTGRLVGPMNLLTQAASFPVTGRSERGIQASLRAGDVAITLSGSVGSTDKDDHNLWTLTGDRGAIRLRDWAAAERLVDGVWIADGAAMPQDRARPLVLQRQLAGVAAMVRGEPHPLATLAEALAVQRIVEAILAA